MESMALVKHENTSIIRSMDDAERAAKAMTASGFFQDAKQMAQAVVKILAGQELGFGPFASMTGVNIIQNKPVLAANLMAAAVKRQGKYNFRVDQAHFNNQECIIHFFEMWNGKFEEVGVSSFNWADAQAAGLTGKDNWKKYPRNMLFARALSNGQKWYAPDVFNGATVYTPDELGAVVDEEGNAVITVTPSEATPAPAPEQPKLTYDQAAELTTTVKGVETRLDKLNKAQLEYAYVHSKGEVAEAAGIVLEHDFNLTQNAAEQQNAEAQAAD